MNCHGRVNGPSGSYAFFGRPIPEGWWLTAFISSTVTNSYPRSRYRRIRLSVAITVCERSAPRARCPPSCSRITSPPRICRATLFSITVAGGAFQSYPVTFHITGCSPSSRAILSVAGRLPPNGGRNKFECLPITSCSADRQPRNSVRVCAADSKMSSG